MEPFSVEVKAKLATVSATVPVGPEEIVVSGGVVSWTVQVRAAGVASTFPAASMARTRNVWLPAARPVWAVGELHAVYAVVESSEHSNLDPASLDVNPKLAEVDVTVPDGPEEIVVCGGVVSLLSMTRRGPLAPVSRLERTRFAEELVTRAML